MVIVDANIILRYLLADSADASVKAQEISVSNLLVLQTALAKYKAKKLDFVDLLLYGYHKVEQATVMTFDQKLNKLLQER